MSESIQPANCKLDLSKKGLITVNETFIRHQASLVCGSWENVTVLNLAENRLKGGLDALPNLSSLLELNVYKNELSGTIRKLEEARSLRTLHLGTNAFSGNLSPLSGASDLESLRLYANRFNGTLEPLSRAVKLKWLYVNHNSITGYLDYLHGLRQLKVLAASMNRISGTLDVVSSMPNLTELSAHDNFLTGTLDPLSNASNLQDLIVMRNSLHGSLFPLAGAHKLRKLLVNENYFSGSLDYLSGATKLTYLDAASNRFFDGQSSVSIQLPYTPIVNLSHNRMDGNIAGLTLPSGGAVLDISGSSFLCKLPDAIGSKDLLAVYDPCDSRQGILYVGGVVVCSLLASILFLAIQSTPRCGWTSSKKRGCLCCRITYRAVELFLLQAWGWFELVADFVMMRGILAYCFAPATACSVVNRPSVFLRLMQFTFLLTPEEEATIGTLQDYPSVAQSATVGKLYPFLVKVNMQTVGTFCDQLANCGYDAEKEECQSTDADSAIQWMVRFSMFFCLVYSLKELCKAFIVVRYSFGCREIPMQKCAICKSSVLCPLLLLRRSNVERILLHQHTRMDWLQIFLLEACSEGFPQMFLNLFYAFSVTTLGLSRTEFFFVTVNVVMNLTMLGRFATSFPNGRHSVTSTKSSHTCEDRKAVSTNSSIFSIRGTIHSANSSSPAYGEAGPDLKLHSEAPVFMLTADVEMPMDPVPEAMPIILQSFNQGDKNELRKVVFGETLIPICEASADIGLAEVEGPRDPIPEAMPVVLPSIYQSDKNGYGSPGSNPFKVVANDTSISVGEVSTDIGDSLQGRVSRLTHTYESMSQLQFSGSGLDSSEGSKDNESHLVAL